MALSNNNNNYKIKLLVIVLLSMFSIPLIAQEAVTYDEAIIYANKKLSESKLLDAKAYYQQALKHKPGDDFAKQQIDEIVERMKIAMELEDEYYDIIDSADELYDKNDLDAAIIKYRQAIKIIPNDEYALDKIREIEKFQKEEKDKIDSFNRSMETGKVYLSDGKYDEAISEFTTAAGIFPDRESPLTELSKARTQKEEFEQKKVLFEEKFEEAERFFTIKKYTEALELYNEALAIMPDNNTVKDKISLVQPLSEKEINYNILIEKADDYYISQDFISAQKQYLQASALWPEKSYPGDMILRINELLDGQKADLDKNYNEYLVSGDSLMQIEEYKLALGKYNLALNLKPNETYPKEKIKDIDDIFELQQKQFEENYQLIIAEGDSALDQNAFDIAKEKYNAALEIKPNDNYPKEKLKEIDILIVQLASQKELDDQYQNVITQADKLFTEGSYDLSLEKYNNALALKPIETYPKDKIKEINDIFELQKKQFEENYQLIIASGDSALNQNAFDIAKTKYNTALELKPNDNYPKEKLKEIDILIIQLASQKELDDQYQNFISQADKLFTDSSYDLALENYNTALALKPNETYPKEKIKEINDIFELRKKQFEENYKLIIASGDSAFNSNAYDIAKARYNAALELKPNDAYPKDKLKEIDILLVKIAAEKELDSQYQNIISQADELFTTGSYDVSLEQYKSALALKPNENYPKEKIKEINDIFELQKKQFEENYQLIIASGDSAFNNNAYDIAKARYNTAVELKPDDEYPKNKIEEIEVLIQKIAEQKELDNKYNAVVAQADGLFSAGNYELSLEKYNEALALKDTENYPQERISEINEILANIEKQRQLDQQYNEILGIALERFNDDKLVDSRNLYTEASELKPSEKFPINQIKTIDSLIIEREKAAELKRQIDELVSAADKLKEEKEYEASIAKYNEALVFVPNDNGIIQKKTEVEAIVENIRIEAERRRSYDSAIVSGDRLFNEESFELSKDEFEKANKLYPAEEYPVKKLADIENELKRLEAEKEERYNKAIAEANIMFDEAKYSEALKKYKLAISIKPQDQLAQQKINECDKFIAERKALMMKEYKAKIAEAEKFYSSKIYDKAILTFREAQALLPSETYPTEMVNKITKYIEDNSIVDIIKTSDTISIGTTEKFDFEPVKINVRKSNYVFIKAKNLTDKSTKLIFSYGSEGSKNGGFVVQVIEGNEFNDYIVRIGNQYKWFSEDNNWLTITPENGTVEIKMLRISRGY